MRKEGNGYLPRFFTMGVTGGLPVAPTRWSGEKKDTHHIGGELAEGPI